MAIIDPKTDMNYGLTVRSIDGQVFCDDGRKVVGWLYCDDCGAPVPVKLNKGLKPYYGCSECNNQHRPQSTTSRKFFEDRMTKLNTGANNHDNTYQNTSEETNQPRQAENSETSSATRQLEGGADSEGSGKRSGGVRVGFF